IPAISMDAGKTDAKADENPQACPCGSKFLSWDTHQICVTCLGLRHTQAALESSEECSHCSRLPLKVLRRLLGRQLTLFGGDPILASAAASQETMDQGLILVPDAEPGPSWGDMLDAVNPCDDDGDSDAGSELLITDKDEDDEPPLVLRGWVTKPTPLGFSKANDGDSSLSDLDVDLHDVCKRAAAKLNIQWPEVQAEEARSRFDDKKLPKAKRTVPFFPELLEEFSVSWCNKLYREKHPVAGGSVLDCEGMDDHGLRQMPRVEQVAAHLHLKALMTLGGSAPSLPSAADCFQSNLMEKSYKVAALSVRAMNASSMLADQAELEEEMTVSPDATLWEEVCIITDHYLHLHKVAIQAMGRAMGLLVLQERARWLNLTTFSTREMEDLLDTPITP
uniref:Uncharacterized protein n=1 Tax=Poecilia formosa TaxID=48698 RepID=A0A096MDS7_POEFO